MENSLIDEKNIRAKPPRQAYLFFPNGEDIIEIDNKIIKNSQRKVFDISEEQYLDF